MLAALLALLLTPAATRAAAVDPGRIVVALSPGGASVARRRDPVIRTVPLRPGQNVDAALRAQRADPRVRWAVPDYLAHASQADIADTQGFIPNDPGRGGVQGWEDLQWNFVGAFGVNAPSAWHNLALDRAYGGRGVTVAVLDTGVAYANHGRFRRSPDFGPGQFVRGRDFIAGDSRPDDHNGHGTHVAGTIAEATNNRVGLTGLAYGARLMPIRVLDSQGEGDASVIALGVRWAVQHHAQVINLSLEFSPDVGASDIPELVAALHYAHRHGVVVVAAAGNEGRGRIAYPARVSGVIAVGSSTEHGCVSDFSDWGTGLALVAPGGGQDANLPGDPNCHPGAPSGRDIFQVTFSGSDPRRFGIPGGYDGTSMAAPHVSATAALIIASGVIGRHPTPDAVLQRLQHTARTLGDPSDRFRYGAGLLDAAAATAPVVAVP